MIDRLLIANRGEIACRIARTAHGMGISTVGVYSEPDRNALHVDSVDVAVALGGATPAESYLRGDADHRGRARHRSDGDPPGLRIPRRERRLRTGGHRRRARRGSVRPPTRSGCSATRSRPNAPRSRPACRPPRSSRSHRVRSPTASRCRCWSRRLREAAGAACASCATQDELAEAVEAASREARVGVRRRHRLHRAVHRTRPTRRGADPR